MNLPPDPDKMNDKRAAWAERAVVQFEKDTGSDREDSICDLLCDLAHFCDCDGQNFDDALRRAACHYYDETRGKGIATFHGLEQPEG